VAAMVGVLDVGWADDLVGEIHDSPSHFPPTMP
jgi:hypothetical protein